MTERVARGEALRAATEDACSTFETYRRPGEASFCTFCYDETEIAYLRATDLRAIDGEHARRIAWESADHWDSVDLYTVSLANGKTETFVADRTGHRSSVMITAAAHGRLPSLASVI